MYFSIYVVFRLLIYHSLATSIIIATELLYDQINQALAHCSPFFERLTRLTFQTRFGSKSTLQRSKRSSSWDISKEKSIANSWLGEEGLECAPGDGPRRESG